MKPFCCSWTEASYQGSFWLLGVPEQSKIVTLWGGWLREYGPVGRSFTTRPLCLPTSPVQQVWEAPLPLPTSLAFRCHRLLAFQLRWWGGVDE